VKPLADDWLVHLQLSGRMAKKEYRTAPAKTDRIPPAVPFIIWNEAAERFSFYGMNAVLVPFMTKHIMDASGRPDLMTSEQANTWYHGFVTVLYFLPTIGAILSDAVLGKYRTILYLSIVYCFGHFALALNETRLGLAFGLSLIAMGAGGIKPCVSANVGDQFGPSNQHLLPKVYSWFYFSINCGSALSSILMPYLLDGFCQQFGLDPKLGPHLAFGTPGIFMVIATIVFWLGRYKYVHIPPGGPKFLKEATSREGLSAFGNLLKLVPFMAMFWAIWQQNFSSWVEQAEHMDRHLFGREWLPAQIQTVNPIFILAFLPLFSYVIYPAVDKVFRLTPLRKISIGLFLTVIAFLIPAWVESRITLGERPTILWQILAYVVLTAAEISVSVTHLEFSYTQAPKTMKSLVMALYLGAMSLGNAFTAVVNYVIQNPDGTSKLSGANYYLFFSGLMFITAVLFVFVAQRYKGRTYIQDEGHLATAAS
jgi:POT family proton-dependent oligopeptide transporter